MGWTPKLAFKVEYFTDEVKISLMKKVMEINECPKEDYDYISPYDFDDYDIINVFGTKIVIIGDSDRPSLNWSFHEVLEENKIEHIILNGEGSCGCKFEVTYKDLYEE